MCKTCGENSCSGCGGIDPSAFLQMQGTLALILAQTKFLAGHPIFALDEPSDIALFDFTTGLGSGIWLGWSICNGTSYPSPTGIINTPDLRDRFLTGAYGSYILGQTGGENTHLLVSVEMPVTSYTITDPGHTHIVTDPGHIHTLTDPGHTHVAVPVAHQHSFTTDPGGAHNHTYEDHERTTIWVGAIAAGPTAVVMYKNSSSTVPGDVELANDDDTYTTRTTSTSANFTLGGTTDLTTEVVNISSSVTAISVDSNTTGITNQDAVTGISIADTGGDQPHENRPPFYSVLWIKKIF